MNPLHLAAPVVFTAALAAQSFTLAAPVPTSVQVQTQQGLMPTTLPAGPLSATGSAVARWSFDDRAELLWQASVTPTATVFDTTVTLALSGPGVASVQPGQLVFTPTTPAVGVVHYESAITVQAPAGAVVPRVEIDVGADGTVEMTQAASSPWLIGWPANGAPLPIRTTIGAALATPGSLQARIRIVARPGNGVTATRMFACCAGDVLRVQPTWNGGIELQSTTGRVSPVVAVLGLQVQPTRLPHVGTIPCILFPTLDLLLFLPDHLPRYLLVPPAVRPVTLWAEAVTVFGLQTSWTWMVDAL